MHILLIDPSRTVLKVIRALLETQGHQVSIAQDGTAALALATAKPDVDVLMTSLELASLSGLELCWTTRCHAIAERRPIYIIAMSSTPSDRKLAEVLDAGADELICKSTSETEIAARLRAAARVNAREQALIEMAMRDPLTDLLNRRAFFEKATALLAACSAEMPVSAAVFDIDHFKSVNDRFGHDVGDKVIRRVSRHASNVGGIVGRLGGEEFGCLLGGVGSAAAFEACEAFRETVMRDPIDIGSVGFRVTVSIGVAESRTPVPPDEILKRADVGVYRAKHGGRNRTSLVPASDDLAMPAAHARVRTA